MKAIEIKNLFFGYSSKTGTLKNINLDINKGEFVAILGHNGSGKSTLAKILVGLLPASMGTVNILGQELNEENVDKLRQHIGIVFQNPDNQFVGVTVKDDIAFGLENRCIPADRMNEIIDEYSKIVGMDKFLDSNPENLSGGQKQRVAIASVLAFMPDIIIFDEATSMLDPQGVREVNEVINSLKGSKTILSITHNLYEAIKADRIIVLNKGEVVLIGTPDEVFKEKEILKASNLDTLDTMKIIEMLENNNVKNSEKVKELLWQLTYNK